MDEGRHQYLSVIKWFLGVGQVIKKRATLVMIKYLL